MKTDMPTLVLDNRGSSWFAWIHDGETIGNVTSLAEALKKAANFYTPCGYVISLADSNKQTTLGVSANPYSYQQIQKGRRKI